MPGKKASKEAVWSGSSLFVNLTSILWNAVMTTNSLFENKKRNVYKILEHLPRAVEIPCPTCPTWSHFIQDKLKISIYLSLDKCKIRNKVYKILYFIFWLIIMSSHVALKTLWVLSACFFRSQLIWIYTVYKRADICMVSYCFLKCKLFKHRKVFKLIWTSKTFFGQVHYGHLLVPWQVENFTISTPLIYRNEWWISCSLFPDHGENDSSWIPGYTAGKIWQL